jgi:hypothetical protein
MNVHVALLHYPVYNQQQEVIVSAVTNLDIHDIARAARTYGVRRFFVITPLRDQLQLVQRLLNHWRQGHGGRCHPERKLALDLVTAATTLAEVVDSIKETCGVKPELVATTATGTGTRLSYSELRNRIRQGNPLLMLFGTGWGLAEEVLEMADYRLDPIYGPGDYNHLSVRSAAAIILDRLLGRSEEEPQ